MNFTPASQADQDETATRRGSVILTAASLSKSFAGRTVLRNVSLELRRGEVVLLRGANGSGKTTLLSILTGHMPPDSGALSLRVKPGVIRTYDFSTNSGRVPNRFVPERIAHEGVVRTWQELRLFGSLTVSDNVAVATPNQAGEGPAFSVLRRFRMRRLELTNQERVSRALSDRGLDALPNAYADQISLGQAKRVDIARALQTGAEVIFLDEPLSGLDARGVAGLLSELRRMVQMRRCTLVIVEHDLNVPALVDLVSRVWHLRDATLQVEEISRSHREVASVRDPFEDWVGSSYPTAQRVDSDLGRGGSLTKWQLFGVGAPSGMKIQNLNVRRRHNSLFGSEGLTFGLESGQLAMLRAPNGWGKSSLLESIVGLTPSTGEIQILGKSVQSLASWRRPCALLSDRPTLFPSLTVDDVGRLFRIDMHRGMLAHLARTKIGDLSAGERQRLALELVMWKTESVVTLLDEPISALDADGRRTVFQELPRLLRRGPVLVAVPTSAPLHSWDTKVPNASEV